MTDLGRKLNHVAGGKCPYCREPGGMGVYEQALSWACGHTYPLPPLHKNFNEKDCEVCRRVRG